MKPKADLAEQKAALPTSLFSVRPTRAARRTGHRILRPEELVWVIDQLRLLRHWPLGPDADGFDAFDHEAIEERGVKFYELKFRGGALRSNGRLRVFVWVDKDTRTIWVIEAYWKKVQKLETAVKIKVARRITEMKGAIQDGMKL